MTTNLLIGFPDIPAAATTTTSHTLETNYGVSNLFGDGRSALCRASTATIGDHIFTFDLGASVTKSANFLIVGRADLLQAGGITSLVLRSHTADSYAAGATQTSTATFATDTLYGPNAEDYVVTFAAGTARRYWHLNLYSAAVDSFCPLSKLYFGTSLDLARDPLEGRSMTRARKGYFSRRPQYRFDLSWEDISYTKTNELLENVARVRDTVPIYLFTQSYHYTLNNTRLMLCRILDITTPPRIVDRNNISMSFEELI